MVWSGPDFPEAFINHVKQNTYLCCLKLSKEGDFSSTCAVWICVIYISADATTEAENKPKKQHRFLTFYREFQNSIAI